MPTWTEPQRQAIALRGHHVLCSAAAGAGKTAALAERVVGRLADATLPLELDQLLIVTFTRAAAAEMRRRIADGLRLRAGATPRLERQLWLLPQADITTVHGFCERTLRRHFASIGLDPAFSVLEPGDARLLRDQALDAAIEAAYAGTGGDGAAFADLVARHGGRRLDEELRTLALRLHTFAFSLPDPDGWLARLTGDVADPGFAEARQAAAARLRVALGRTAQAIALALRPDGPGTYLEALESDQSRLEGLLQATDGPWDNLAAALVAAPSGLARLKAVGKDPDRVIAERVRTLRDANKDLLRQLAAGPFGRPEAEHRAETRRVAAQLSPLIDLVRDLDHRFAAAKARLAAVDFNDLEHLCLRVLQGPAGPLAAGRYAEVLVDESQDLSPVQDEVLAALCGQGQGDGGSARPPLFAVGDARQSIYGFRQADPGRFIARAQTYTASGLGVAISLPHNFRSRPRVIAGVNRLFGPLFAAGGSGLPPELAEPLIAAADYPPPDPPLHCLLLEGDDDGEEATATEREAQAVAELAERWLHEGEVAGPDGPRSPGPADIAVLLRSPGTSGHIYLEALQRRGLPAWSASGAHRAQTAEGRAVLSWLQVLDNPHQDIPLAAVLRGPFAGFTDSELAEIRLGVPGPRQDLWTAVTAMASRDDHPLGARLRAWLADLSAWRDEVRRGRFAAPLVALLAGSGYRAAVAALPGGAARLATLDWLVERCRQAERFALAELDRLIALIESEEGGETVAEAAAAAGDAVKILSVHASKGLEFPCVVVAGLGRAFNLQDARGDVLVHRAAGLGARAVDLEHRVRWPTLRHAAVAARIEADARAEELRLLYVACTRARERLALVATRRNVAEAAANWAAASATPDLAQGTSPLDWLGPVLAQDPDVRATLAADGPATATGVGWQIDLRPGPEVAALAEAARTEGGETDPAPAPPPAAAPSPASPGGVDGGTAPGEAPAEVLARLDAEYAWVYPHAGAAALAAKATVGELRDRPGPDEEPAQDAGPPARTTPLPRPRLPGAPPRPTPAELGSATHLVLRFLDLTGPCDPAALGACVADLVDREVLEAAAGAAVDTAALARLLDRPLGRRLRAAAAGGRLRREVPFALRLPAEQVHGDGLPPGEWVLVQGIIDALVVSPEGLILVDYKTDRIGSLRRTRHGPVAGHPPGRGVALVDRYSRQVVLYAQAAAAAWRLPVTEAWLAFLPFDQRVPLA